MTCNIKHELNINIKLNLSLLQNLKDQILTTNVWLEHVSTKFTLKHKVILLPKLLIQKWIFSKLNITSVTKDDQFSVFQQNLRTAID